METLKLSYDHFLGLSDCPMKKILGFVLFPPHLNKERVKASYGNYNDYGNYDDVSYANYSDYGNYDDQGGSYGNYSDYGNYDDVSYANYNDYGNYNDW